MNQDNQYVIVYESNDENQILAFIVLWDYGSYFEIRLVEANRLYPTNIHPGSYLIEKIDDISRQFGYKKIIVDVLEKKVPLYKILGYVEDQYNESYLSEEKGRIIPMIKWL